MKKVLDYSIYAFAIVGFVLTAGFLAIKFGLTNEKGIIDEQRNSFVKMEPARSLMLAKNNLGNKANSLEEASTWQKSEEWKVLREAIIKDREPINKAAAMLAVQPRLVVSILIVEQLRLFNDNRELFKTVFAPLKILGNQSQFSWGVMGIKQETAVQTEENLKNATSTFFAGEKYEHVLDFTTDNHGEERFSRLVNENDRYYSYLYGATIIKEIEVQWENAGYDIRNRPDIISTLFNIGFQHSNPNADPKSGGAQITIGTTTYSFGKLALDFYNSNELLDEFPR